METQPQQKWLLLNEIQLEQDNAK